ncbi:MAG: pyridoxal-phosphate dependent enzyme [Acidobacteriota bacterium]|nr:pyridoxal-phosphate dependent enzyme [Blastocatellia bacterium]MDW8412823.1 pyridoxal-phosphate dependent enzyme [Acidobacteriota bacterium]
MKPLKQAIRPTTIVNAARLSKRLGIDLTIASETFQYTGSFKFRAAYNLVINVSQSHIIAASSGNFGQALAYACSLVGKACTVVMPKTSARVKIDAVREFAAEVDLIDVHNTSREQRVAELCRQNPGAYLASAYDDPWVIEGNATLGDELAAFGFDVVVVPVGGGGLASGILLGLRRSGSEAELCLAEPAAANDAALSLKLGYIVKSSTEPQTIADGAKTVSLGERNFAILKNNVSGIIEVTEEAIKQSVRMLYALVNLKAEPTGALSLAAVLTKPELFVGKRVCLVVSGANVDAALYSEIILASNSLW